ncbi:MAG TPA: hypothetical protein GX714_04090 [Chloroflexi bacterium]|jgi:hypothetical protein|nr:hypothetical protein [Chloroflexota bacterium]
MADKAWKRTEREVARRLGGRRAGCTGRVGPDVIGNWLQVEVKTRRKLPEWIQAALQQAQTGCPEHRLPLAVLHQAGQRHDDDIVCLRLADFTAWFGPPQVGREDSQSVDLEGGER